MRVRMSDRARFFQLDTSVVYSKTSAPNVEVLSVTEALDKYDWLKGLLVESRGG